MLKRDRPLEGVIFDVGGTLVHHQGSDFEHADASGAAGQLHAWGELRADNVPRFVEILMNWRSEHPKADAAGREINTTRDALRAVAARFGVALEDSRLELLERAFVAPSVRAVTPVTGMIEVVSGLRGRVRLAVISNARSARYIEGAVRSIGLRDAFEPLLVSAAFGWRKPSLRPFEHVLRAWQVPPGAVAMVGDSPARDVAPAQSLGIRGVWLTIASIEDPSDVRPDAIARTPEDLSSLLRTWGVGSRTG